MAANMQSMAGPGQMMPQQSQIPAALAQHVANALRMTQQQLSNPTWQTAVPLPDRMSKVMQMISNVRLANPNTDIMQATNYGIGFEREMFSKMPTKENYDQAMTNKTNEFFRKRQQNEPALQQQLSQSAQAQAMMNMNLQQQMGRGMNPQAFQSMPQGMQPMTMQQQQVFQQQRLQQQAAAQRQQQQVAQQQQGQQQLRQPQLPQQGQQLQQQPQAGNAMNAAMGMGGMGGMGMGGMGMNVNMANQAGRGMNPNHQMANMANGMPRQAQGNMAQLNPNDRARILELANKLMMQASDESKQNASIFVRSRMTPQQLQEFQASGRDPAVFYYQQQAANVLRTRQRQLQQQQGQQGQPQGQTQVQGQAPPMQQQHSQQAMQHQNAMANAQGANGFNQFPPSMESIKDQQLHGMKAQEAGQVVVPASMTQAMNRGSQPMGQTMSNQQHPNQGVRQPQQTPQQQQQGQNMQQRKMNQGSQPSPAQLQAQAQMTQMQQQPSNMGGAMGPGQSPGMGTLNTPVTRPGSGMNQMVGGQGMGQGNVQFGDQRFPPGMQRPNNQVYNAMLADLTPEQRQQIGEFPPEKIQEMTRRWQLGRQNQMNMAQQNMNQMANRTPSQMGGQQAVNMPGQGAQGVQQPQQQANMAQAQAMMDNMDIPDPMLQQLSQFVQLGPDVKKWRDLRAWVGQNSNALPPQIKNELGSWQRRQFQAVLARRANQANGQNMGMNQAAATNAGGQMPMGQNGMARAQPAQAMPPHLLQVTAHDLNQIRATKPQFAGLTDEHLRNMVLAMKKNAWQQRQSQMATQAQNQNQGQGQVPVGQMTPSNMTGPQANMQLQQPPTPMGQNAQAQRAQNSANQNTPAQNAQQQKGPETAASNRNAKKPQSQPQPQPTPSPAQGVKNLKRPNSDDADASAANQKPKPAQIPGQKALPQLSQEDIANMKPEQRAKYEQLRRAQAAATQGSQAPQPSQTPQAAQAAQGGQAPTNAQAVQKANESLVRLKSIGQEEQRTFSQQSMPDIPMSSQELQETAQRLQRMVGDMSKIGKGLSKWYSLTQDDNRARLFFRMRLRILKQFVDGEHMTVLKDTFSIHCTELDQARAMLESMAKDLARSVFGRNMMKPPGQQGQGAAQKPQAAAQGTPQMGAQSQQQSPQTAPLNAANLEKNSQALKAQKQAGKGFKVPTAPTTTQPPFSFASPSPHGNPSYANAKDPPMELKIPPRKKSRVSQAATPSPQISKASPPRPQSQDLQHGARAAEPQKPVLTCKEPECEHSAMGYATEEALQKHVDEEHIKPREDPLRFVEESLALALGLEPDGTPKKEPNTAAAAAAAPMATTMSKQGRPTMKDGVNTPDSTTSMKRSASSQKDAKTAIKSDKANDATAALGAAMDPWANASFDPKSIMTTLGLENGISSVIFDVNAFRALTPDWTPESRDEPSEPNSDISDGAQLDIDLTWQMPDQFDTDLLLDLDKTSLQGDPAIVLNNDVPTMDPSLLFTSVGAEVPDWEEIKPDFTKPFELDTSLYAMDYES